MVDKSKLLLRLPQMRFSVWWYNNGAETNVFCLESHSGDLPLLPPLFKPISGLAKLGRFPTGISTAFLTRAKRKKLMLTISISPNSVIATVQWGHQEKMK